MRTAEIPYLADWYAISIRWMIIIGFAISLGMGSRLTVLLVVILALAIAWNGFVSALAIFNHRLGRHRIVNVVVDLLIATSLFGLTGGLNGDVWWAGLLPIFTATTYFDRRGAITLTITSVVVQTALLYLAAPQLLHILPLFALVGFHFVCAVIVTVITLPLINRLRRAYQAQVLRRQEAEQRAQRQERDRMRLLFAMIETFSSTLHYQKVLETALETAAAALEGGSGDSRQMISAVLLFEDRYLSMKASRHMNQPDLKMVFPAEAGVLAETLKSGEHHLVRQPSGDPELGHLTSMEEQAIALCLPLIRGMNAYGVMVFAHAQPNFFTPDRVDVLQMVSNQAVIAIQNARLFQDLAAEKERLVQSQEEAQKKLARDLHDGPTQSVAAIAMQVSIARKLMERSPQQALQELERIEELARRTTQEIRHMLFTMRPLVLENEGLIPALTTMAEKMRDLYQQNVVIDADPLVVSRLDASIQSVVFHLAEEAVNNARKHAAASEIRVHVRHPANETSIALMEIIDNGQGFDVQSILGAYDRRGSLGMVNLRERTDMVNGLMKIDSVPGKGTRIRVFIPLCEEAADRLHHGRQR